MKKIALSLLLSTAIITNVVKAVDTTTDLGPIQIVTSDGSNAFAPGIVKLNGTILLGQSSIDTITIQGQYITNGSGIGSNQITSVMSIDSNGQMVTGPLTELGSSGNNRILAHAASGDLSIISDNAANVVLESASHIKILSATDLITSLGADPVVLALDSNNHIVSSNKPSLVVFGDNINPDTSFISVDNNATNPTGIILNTSGTASSNITFNAGANNSIFFIGNGIINPATGKTSLLLLDETGKILTAGINTPIVCGSLTAAGSAGETISLGIPGNNAITFISDSGNIDISATNTGADLNLVGDQNIKISSSAINKIANDPAWTVLALDTLGNIVTSEKSDVFVYGSTNATDNYIKLDNATPSNGVIIGGPSLYLEGQGLTPAAGYTNTLTIDENNKIGIVVSSAKYKEDIKSLNINDDSFDKLQPVSYNYIGKNHTEYGFIAEDLAQNESLKNAVIFNKNGEAMSINYNAVFVAVTHQFLKTKKALNERIKTLEVDLIAKDEKIAELTSLYLKLEKAMKELSAKLA